jgi:hypothetical protein
MYLSSPHDSTLSQNLAASIIKEGFGTLNFDVGRGL